MDKVSIMDMANGAIKERVDYEVGAIIANILDPNTKADAARKITVTLTLKPDCDRQVVSVSAVSKSTPCPTSAIQTSLFITTLPGTGEMVVGEMVPNIPGQLGLDGEEQAQPKILDFKMAASR
jgi:hypothetical protein